MNPIKFELLLCWPQHWKWMWQKYAPVPIIWIPTSLEVLETLIVDSNKLRSSEATWVSCKVISFQETQKHDVLLSSPFGHGPWPQRPGGQSAPAWHFVGHTAVFIFVPWVNITNDPQDDLAVLPGNNTADYGASWITALAVARLESLSFSRRRRIMLLPTWPWHQRWGWGAWGAGNTAVRRVLRIKWEN